MNRRQALQNIGLSVGTIATAPSILSLVQSCTGPSVEWTPRFFTKKQAGILSELADMILPPSQGDEDLPGATQLNVPKFVDAYIDAMLSKEEKTNASKATEVFVSVLGDKSNYTNTLDKYLKASAEQQGKWRSEVSNNSVHFSSSYFNFGDLSAESSEISNKDAIAYQYIYDFRSLIVMGYKTTEFIGEEVLAYESIPGRQIGCGNLDELTGGVHWSL